MPLALWQANKATAQKPFIQILTSMVTNRQRSTEDAAAYFVASDFLARDALVQDVGRFLPSPPSI